MKYKFIINPSKGNVNLICTVTDVTEVFVYYTIYQGDKEYNACRDVSKFLSWLDSEEYERFIDLFPERCI